MPKVEMPMASWESVLMSLEMLMNQGYYVKGEYEDIKSQIERQET